MKIGFIGRGRVGHSLASYFSAHDIYTVLISGSLDSYIEYSYCDVLFLTVPDSAIRTVSKKIPQNYNGIVCHCSGALSSDVLENFANVCSVHPLLAVSNENTAMNNAFFTLEGSDSAVNAIEILLHSCGNSCRKISKEDKAKYHASACFASNFVISVCQKAYTLLEECGFSQEEAKSALDSLMLENMNNIHRTSPKSALTGPVDRNDIHTIRTHLSVLDSETAQLYKSCSKELLKLSKERHPNIDYTTLENLLK